MERLCSGERRNENAIQFNPRKFQQVQMFSQLQKNKQKTFPSHKNTIRNKQNICQKQSRLKNMYLMLCINIKIVSHSSKLNEIGFLHTRSIVIKVTC